MSRQTIRDRVWLWGMKVNVLQETAEYGTWGFGASSMTVEDAIQKTGVTNVIIAGHLPISEETLVGMPSAKRIICKWHLHNVADERSFLDYDGCLSRLMDTKALLAKDTRIDGFHIDDFTCSLDVGLTQEHMARLLYENAVTQPRLPLGATIYPQILDRPDLPPFLQYFDMYLTAIWDADRIEHFSADIARLSDMSGAKPILLCLYLYDFGGQQPLLGAAMRRHLEVAERLLREGLVMGLCVCGTCMMDLDWESNRVLYKWLEESGDDLV